MISLVTWKLLSFYWWRIIWVFSTPVRFCSIGCKSVDIWSCKKTSPYYASKLWCYFDSHTYITEPLPLNICIHKSAFLFISAFTWSCILYWINFCIKSNCHFNSYPTICMSHNSNSITLWHLWYSNGDNNPYSWDFVRIFWNMKFIFRYMKIYQKLGIWLVGLLVDTGEASEQLSNPAQQGAIWLIS